jgi:hypothetical protein
VPTGTRTLMAYGLAAASEEHDQLVGELDRGDGRRSRCDPALEGGAGPDSGRGCRARAGSQPAHPGRRRVAPASGTADGHEHLGLPQTAAGLQQVRDSRWPSAGSAPSGSSTRSANRKFARADGALSRLAPTRQLVDAAAISAVFPASCRESSGALEPVLVEVVGDYALHDPPDGLPPAAGVHADHPAAQVRELTRSAEWLHVSTQPVDFRMSTAPRHRTRPGKS